MLIIADFTGFLKINENSSRDVSVQRLSWENSIKLSYKEPILTVDIDISFQGVYITLEKCHFYLKEPHLA